MLAKFRLYKNSFVDCQKLEILYEAQLVVNQTTLKISGENHFPRLRYGTLKFAFDRTQIKNDASHIYIFTKNQKVRLCGQGRPDFSFLFKSCEILEVRGDLSINVENKKSSRVDRQACKNYALALVLCAFNNSKSIQKRIKSIFQILN